MGCDYFAVIQSNISQKPFVALKQNSPEKFRPRQQPYLAANLFFAHFSDIS
jgi:hypothetical protein